MNLTYKTVKGSQQERPAELDTTSSPGLVYLRRNIEQITEPSGMGEDTVTLWQYEEAAITHEQYQQYKAELENVGQQQIMDELRLKASDDNQLIIMEAIADIYDLIASLS